MRVDEPLLDAVRRAAAYDGVDEEQLVEEALRRYFGLRGLAVTDEMAERASRVTPTSDEDAMALAVTEMRGARAEHHRARRA